MRTVELCSGTKSFSKIAAARGHTTFTVDIDPSLNPDAILDLTKPIPEWLWNIIAQAGAVWMSPVCTGFSMAARNTHFDEHRRPKTSTGRLSLALLERCKEIAAFCAQRGIIFFIENPVARARWFMPEDETRHEVWYCKYGEKRAKPTDIWTNLKGWNSRKCKKGNPECGHERAPRGSKTGTQGIKGAKNRGIVPPSYRGTSRDCRERRGEKWAVLISVAA